MFLTGTQADADVGRTLHLHRILFYDNLKLVKNVYSQTVLVFTTWFVMGLLSIIHSVTLWLQEKQNKHISKHFNVMMTLVFPDYFTGIKPDSVQLSFPFFS